MKLSLLRIAATSLVILLAGIPAAVAQTSGKILIVDMMRVQEQAVAAKSVQAQIRDLGAKLQAQAKTAEEKVKADEAKLKQQQTLLSPEQFDEQRRAFEAQVGQAQRTLQERERDIQAAVRKAQGALLQALQPILNELLVEKGGSIMVDRRSVLSAAEGLDVTSAVIERLDKRLTALKVEVVKQK